MLHATVAEDTASNRITHGTTPCHAASNPTMSKHNMSHCRTSRDACEMHTDMQGQVGRIGRSAWALVIVQVRYGKGGRVEWESRMKWEQGRTQCLPPKLNIHPLHQTISGKANLVDVICPLFVLSFDASVPSHDGGRDSSQTTANLLCRPPTQHAPHRQQF